MAELLLVPQANCEFAPLRECKERPGKRGGGVGLQQCDIRGLGVLFLQLMEHVAVMARLDSGVLKGIKRLVSNRTKEIGANRQSRIPNRTVLPHPGQYVLHEILSNVLRPNHATSQLDHRGAVLYDDRIEYRNIAGPNTLDTLAVSGTRIEVVSERSWYIVHKSTIRHRP